jgi:hypothetical protein
MSPFRLYPAVFATLVPLETFRSAMANSREFADD